MLPRDCAIQPSTPAGAFLGFSDLEFAVDSYIWIDGQDAYVGFVESLAPGEGNFSKLIKAISSLGFNVCVPTPFPQMEAIVCAKGFTQRVEYSQEWGANVEVWVLASEAPPADDGNSSVLNGWMSDSIGIWKRTKYGHAPSLI